MCVVLLIYLTLTEFHVQVDKCRSFGGFSFVFCHIECDQCDLDFVFY